MTKLQVVEPEARAPKALPTQLPLTPLTVDRFRELWPVIRPWLEEIRQRTRDLWQPEDIYAAVASGGAFPFAMEGGGALEGLMVGEPQNRFGTPVLNWWLCYHRAANGRTIANYWEAALDIARQLGAKRMSLVSPRPVNRVVPMDIVYHTCICEVSYGPLR